VEAVPHSFSQLEAALAAAPNAVQKLAPSAQVISVGIFEPHNGIVVAILDDEVNPGLEAGLADELAVPVEIEIGAGALTPGACPSRSQPCTPEKGGVRIGTTAGGCTMGFHFMRGTDRQFLTAGHCSDQPSQSKTWYQPSTSAAGRIYLGPQRAQLYTNATKTIDIQRVELPNAQASRLIFDEGTRQVSSSDVPYTGQVVCASLGYSVVDVDCGTVKYAVGQYLLEGYYRVGTDTNRIITQGGDSGAPLYWRGASVLVALGICSAGQSGGENVDRWWGRVEEAFLRWDWEWEIYH
jgi:hypothetical protein